MENVLLTRAVFVIMQLITSISEGFMEGKNACLKILFYFRSFTQPTALLFQYLYWDQTVTVLKC